MSTRQSTAAPNRMVLRYWVILNAIDALLTGLALMLGAVEGNMVLQLFSSQIGDMSMLFVKVLIALAIGGILWERGKTRILVALNYAMVAVVFYNMLVITYAL